MKSEVLHVVAKENLYKCIPGCVLEFFYLNFDTNAFDMYGRASRTVEDIQEGGSRTVDAALYNHRACTQQRPWERSVSNPFTRSHVSSDCEKDEGKAQGHVMLRCSSGIWWESAASRGEQRAHIR
jgi:hypothetical protein